MSAREPLPAPGDLPRRWTEDPLPPYRYVPGLYPHPFRSPEGHAWTGGAAPEAAPWSPGPWASDVAFLRGVDLFHARYLWEAHEVWEGLWRQAGLTSGERSLLQALVQAAAALLQRHVGEVEAAVRLGRRAVELLSEAETRGGPVVHGVACATFAASLRQALDDGGWPLLRLPGRPPLRVVAGAVFHGGRVLAALRRPDVARGDLWELPGGKVEQGEDDAAALERELMEELGAEVEVDGFLAEHVHDYGDVAIRLVALGCRQVGGVLEARDHAALRWVSADELDGLRWAPADVPLLEAVRRRLVARG